MYKIAFIGPKLESLGLLALGVESRVAKNPAEAIDHLKELLKSKEYAIIFIAEYLAAEISSEIKSLRGDSAAATIVPISDSRGSFGLGSDIISLLTKKALGKEIKIST